MTEEEPTPPRELDTSIGLASNELDDIDSESDNPDYAKLIDKKEPDPPLENINHQISIRNESNGLNISVGSNVLSAEEITALLWWIKCNFFSDQENDKRRDYIG